MRTDSIPISFCHRHLVGGLLSGVLSVLLGPGLRADDTSRPESAAIKDPGQLIYVKECASCHGKTGEGVQDVRLLPQWSRKLVRKKAQNLHNSGKRLSC